MREKIIEDIKKNQKPSAKKWLEKELFKVNIATQYIGNGCINSSTEIYKKVYEKYNLANTGNYNEKDIIWVSVNGKRKDRFNPIINNELMGVYKNIDIAILNDSLFILDTKKHLDKTKLYNIGEIQIQDYLIKKNYIRDDETGIWKPFLNKTYLMK